MVLAANILLVSNDASLRAQVQGTLIFVGYKVNTVYKGINGLTLALLKPPHLLLIDDGLPDMSNIEFISRVKNRQELESIPVAAIANNLIQDQCRQYRRAGATGCLFKPFTGEQLVNFVREYVQPQQIS